MSQSEYRPVASSYPRGPAGGWPAPPPPSFKNRLLMVLGGLAALLILGCMGLTALGMVVGANTVVLLLSNWTVTKQSTPAGSKVSTDTLIVLTCTKKR